jgi:hypothetical protein
LILKREIQVVEPLLSKALCSNPSTAKKEEEEEEESQNQWLTPIILPTQEAEIWRIEVQRQPGAK